MTKLQNCPDCPFESRTCGPRGPVDSRLVIIGESPGDNELRLQRAFIGKSGELLQHLLKEVGFSDEPYITNAFKCGPPGGDRKTEELINTACRACNERLIEELTAHPRKLIITMGNGATRATLGRYNIAISSVRGAMQESNLASIGILPTYHPAHILRNEGLYPQLLADMKKAVTFMKEGVPTDPSTSYKIMDNREVAKEFIEKSKGKVIAADIETTGLSFKQDEFTCIGMAPVDDLSTTYIIDGLPKEKCWREDYNHIFAKLGKSTSWLWHNGKFDTRFLRGQDWLDHKCRGSRVDHDTMLLSYALDENGGRHGLEQCVMDWLGVPAYKTMLSDYTKIGNEIKKKLRKLKLELNVENSILAMKEIPNLPVVDDKELIEQWIRTGANNKSFALVPRTLLWDYLTKDIYYTGSLYNKLYPMIQEDEHLNKLYHELLIPASNALATVEINGLPLNQFELDKSIKAVQLEIDPLVEKLRGITGNETYNPNSGPQTGEQLVNMGFKIVSKTKAGLPSTGEEVLERYASQPRQSSENKKFIETLLEYRKWQKVQSTYLKPYKKLGDRIHPTFSIHGTVTGRLSCLHGDTLIYVLDEREKVKIKDIKVGDWVWSYDDDLKPVPTQVEWQGKTGTTSHLVRVTYTTDNKDVVHTIICTPNHKFRLRTGEYIQASNLLPRTKVLVVTVDKYVNDKVSIYYTNNKYGGHHISQKYNGLFEIDYLNNYFRDKRKNQLEHNGAIISVEFLSSSSTDVYDITIPEHHNFIAEGVCVHNSSSPNLQNLPKYGPQAKLVRRAIKAEKGRVLISLDYSQAELRSLAVLSGDEALMEIFRNGEDMHSSVAAKVFGKDYTKAQRTGAKRVNFGVIYGAGPPKLQEQILADGVQVTLADAQSYIEMWSEAYPVAWEFIQKTRNLEDMEKTLITVFGRKRRFHVLHKANWHTLENKAGNFLHQSMCSDFTLESCIRQDAILGGLPGNPIQVNIVHDDNLMEVDDNPDAIVELIKNVKEIMEQVPIDMGISDVPFVADAEVGTDWGNLREVDMESIKIGKLRYAKKD